MSQNRVPMNFAGALSQIPKSKNMLTPVYEAVTNSLEAIDQRSAFPSFDSPSGLIEIQFLFSGLLDDGKELEQVVIIDNGIGFNNENYQRFEEFFDSSKGYGNRGTGRIQFLQRFAHAEVVSIFSEEGESFKRIVSCNNTKFITNHSLISVPISAEIKTTLTLGEPIGNSRELKAFNNLTIDELTNELKSHFLLRLYLEKQKNELSAPQIDISFYQGNSLLDKRHIGGHDIPSPEAQSSVSVPYTSIRRDRNDNPEIITIPGREATLNWAHFAIPHGELSYNGIFLCSKNIPIESVNFSQIKKKEQVAGYRYLTVFYGEVLDDPKSVNDSVDSFTFPSASKILENSNDMLFDWDEEYLLIDSIKQVVGDAIPGIYKEVIDVQDTQQSFSHEIAKAHGISKELVTKANIHLSDDEQTITNKLFKAQAAQLAEKGYKVRKVFESLKALNPMSDIYQDELKDKAIELSTLVDEQNKEELSRFIIRREMVTELLNKILKEELDYQTKPRKKGERREPEGLIHDLIFKRKSRDSGALNDLWVLNEEFVHYDGCSELPISQITLPDGQLLLKDAQEAIQALGLKVDQRPDIFLYPEEGKCLLIEFKAPEEDLSNHLNQMIRYCNLIANFGTKKITGFYCYLIGETFNPVTDLDGDYKATVNGDWIRPNISIVSMDENRNTIANAQIEIIRLSSLHNRAHRRNLSFAQKLGIEDILSDSDNG